MIFNQLIDELKACPEIAAIALGGSRAGHQADQYSDYDVYVYLTEPLSAKKREVILSKYCKVMEIDNHYWEREDNCVLNNDIDIDIIYRSLDNFLNDLNQVVRQYHAHNGYTTCMWHNLIHSQILIDKTGRLTEARENYQISYPQPLKKAIIEKNMHLLTGKLPSYDKQIKKAIERHDLNSMHHRTTEFLASYFDIIFALNEMTHPGEKKLVKICLEQCSILPEHFEENLNTLFQSIHTPALYAILQKIIKALAKVLQKENIIVS